MTVYYQSAGNDARFLSANDWQKRWDLVSRRNVSIEEAALVCGGRLLHIVVVQQNAFSHIWHSNAYSG